MYFQMAEKMDCVDDYIKLEDAEAPCTLNLDPLDLIEGLPDLEVVPTGTHQVLALPGPPGPAASVAGPSGHAAPAVAGAPAPKKRVRSLSCSACPRAFGERKRLRAHWETAHAVSFVGFRCPHAGCCRAFHKDHRQHFKIHLKSGHAYSPEQVSEVFTTIRTETVPNDHSDGKATHVAPPVDLVTPPGAHHTPARTPAKKRASESRENNRPSKAPRFAVGQDVLREVVKTMDRAQRSSATQQDEERTSWKKVFATQQQRIRDLEAEVASLKAQLKPAGPVPTRSQSATSRPRNVPSHPRNGPSRPKNGPNHS